jgi:hypothetical protein
VSAASAEPVDAARARAALLAALSAADGPLGDALASLDPEQRQRLSGRFSAPDLPVKTCEAPKRGMDRCGRPGAMMRCMEDFIGRGRCSDAP